MAYPFDIFKITEKGELIWLEALPTLDAAMTRVRLLKASFPGEYMIYSQSTGKKIHLMADGRIHRR